MAKLAREPLLAAMPYLSPPDREWVRVRLSLSDPTELRHEALEILPSLTRLARLRDSERLIALARQVRAEAAQTVADARELLSRVQEYQRGYYFGG